MPHSSGGGSSSGGSHSGSSSRHHERKILPMLVNNATQGYTRYAFYRKGRISYRYVKDRPNGLDWGAILSFALFLAMTLVGIFVSFSLIVPPNPDTYDSRIVIEDQLDVLTSDEEADLEEAFEAFRDKTGIACALITEPTSAWENQYSSLETYAYDLYLSRWSDENHWLFVYTASEEPDARSNTWNWEGMQGNDTDSVLTTSVTRDFNRTLQSALEQDEDAVGTAFLTAITETTQGIKASGYHIDWLMLIGCSIGSVILAVMLVMELRLERKDQRKEAAEINELHSTGIPVPENAQEDTCEYCGGTYIHGQHKNCPHCNAPIQNS